MAFTTTQTLDSVLQRGVAVRVPQAVGPAASTVQYALYANAVGQTYWSNTVAPQNISSLSTNFAFDLYNFSTITGNTFIQTYDTLSSIQSTIQFQSTGIQGLEDGLVSTTFRLLNNDQTQSNSIGNLSNTVNFLSNQIGNVLAARVDSIYVSTVKYVQSSLYGISTFSTFQNEIDFVKSTLQGNVSTLERRIAQQNQSTFSTLTRNYNQELSRVVTSTNNYIYFQISSLSSVIANKSDVDTLSTALTTQLLSTSGGIYESLSTTEGFITTSIDSIYKSSITSVESTIKDVQRELYDYSQLSTFLSSISNLWISSFVSTSQYFQDIEHLSYTDSVSIGVVNLLLSTNSVYSAFSTYSTTVTTRLNDIVSTNANLNSSIRSLQYEFSVITTSSILAGIYETFIQLEGYTSTIVGNVIGSAELFKSSLAVSTAIQNMSISKAYYNFWQSTLYASTLSTLIPSTIAFTSSMVSTLYSTSYSFVASTMNSTMFNIAFDYISTTSSIFRANLLSTQALLNSSITGHLSIPTGAALIQFSTIGGSTIRVFQNAGLAQLSTQDALFRSTMLNNQSSFNVLYISSQNLWSSTLNSLARLDNAVSNQLSTFSTQFSRQQSTQTVQHISTLTGYPPLITTVINSTNSGTANTSLVIVNSTIRRLETSTLTAFNNFLNVIALQVSTVALSTLYTEQTVNLTGSNFVGTLDFGNFRNFNINIFNIVDGASNYRVTYPAASLPGLNYRKGLITLNISTVGLAYGNNNSLLQLDLYRWGIPTTVYGNMYPYISNADYIMQYEYNILNQTVYTNLLNVYPRLAVRSPTISSLVRNVRINNDAGLSSNHFWRGTPVQINWSNYSFFPYNTIGAPPYNPEVNLEVIVNNATVAEYGPYPLSQSSVTILAPYLQNQLIPVVTTTVRAYVVGQPRNFVETNFNTVLPTFDTVVLQPQNYPASTRFIGGTELVAITDSNRYPMVNTLTSVATFTSTIQFFMNDLRYRPEHLVGGILNRVGAVGQDAITIINGSSNVPGQFQEVSATSGFPDFFFTVPNYFNNPAILQNYGARFTFILSNAFNSYSFQAESITPITTSTFRVSNPNLIKTTNTYPTLGQTVFLRYRYTPVPFMSTSAVYSASTFVGPVAAGTPDVAAFLTVNGVALTSRMDPVSTLTFYNVVGAPITPANVNGMQVIPYVSYAGNTYSSTINVTTEPTQVFRF